MILDCSVLAIANKRTDHFRMLTKSIHLWIPNSFENAETTSVSIFTRVIAR